jgi:hypothetical protein
MARFSLWVETHVSLHAALDRPRPKMVRTQAIGRAPDAKTHSEATPKIIASKSLSFRKFQFRQKNSF